jgi:hypothetical protein
MPGAPADTVASVASIEATLFGGDTIGVAAAAQRLPNSPAGLFAGEALRLLRGDVGSVDRTVTALRKTASEREKDDALRMAALLEAWGAVRRRGPRAQVERLLVTADSAMQGWEHPAWSLILGRLYEELGLFDRGLIAIRRRHTNLAFPFINGLAEALRLEGRLAAKTGDRDGAILAYRRYLLMRSDAEPSKIPQRDSVVAELAALTGKR